MENKKQGIDPYLLQWLAQTKEAPRSLSDLSRIKHLEIRNYSDTKYPIQMLPGWLICEEGDWTLIGEMSNLQTIEFPEVELSDFLFLAGCKKLRRLNLIRTKFSDCSLLLQLPELTSVMLPARKKLIHTEVLNVIAANVSTDEPFYSDEDFADMVVIDGADVKLSYEGVSKVQCVYGSFSDKALSFLVEFFSQEECNWSSLEPEKAVQIAAQLGEEILHGNVRNLFLSFEPWGEGHYLTVDIDNGWAAVNYMDDDSQVYYSSYNASYDSVEELSPVEIGGQTPVPKLFALEDMQLVKKIVLFFLETGQLCPGTQWEKSEDLF